MPALLAEILGRWLWTSTVDGIRFVGAMLATGALLAGTWIGVTKLVKSWHNRHMI